MFMAKELGTIKIPLAAPVAYTVILTCIPGLKRKERKVQKVIGYVRVSTTGQAEEGVSLEAQRAKIQAWCNLNDGELVALFEDAGISGSGMVKRDGLQDALKATAKGMALVTYSISRLARNTRDMLD